jgi:hypothetical protein
MSFLPDRCGVLTNQGFWTVVNFMTDGLLLSAFILRVMGIRIDLDHDPKQAAHLQLKSFQVLSCVAPLIWMKLVSSLFSCGARLME